MRSQLGEAILTVGGTAKTLKGGMTEASTAIGILSDNGIKASEAGTALRNVILNLAHPRNNIAAATMERLGLSAWDAEGNMRPLNEVLIDLNRAMSEMTSEEKSSTITKIFNKTDLKSVNALLANTSINVDDVCATLDKMGYSSEELRDGVNNLAAGFSETTDITTFTNDALYQLGISLEDAEALYDVFTKSLADGSRWDELEGYIQGAEGSAENMAKTMINNLEGSITILKSALSELMISIGHSLIPTISKVVEWLTKMADKFNSLPDGAKTAIATFGVVIAAIGPLLIFFGKLILSVNAIMKVFKKFEIVAKVTSLATKAWGTVCTVASAAGTALAGVAGFLGISVGALVGIIAGVIAAGVLLWKNWDTIKEYAGKLGEYLSQKWQEISESCSEFFSGLGEKMSEIWQSIKDGAVEKWNEIKQSVIDAVKPIKEGLLVTWSGIQNTLITWGENIKNTFKSIWEGAKEITSSIWEGLKAFFVNWFNNIMSIISPILDMIVSVISDAWNTIANVSSSIWEVVKSVISGAWDVIKAVVELGAALIQAYVLPVWERIKIATQTAWQTISGCIQTVWNTICNAVGTAVAWVVNGVVSKWNALVQTVSSIWQTIKNAIVTKWNGIVADARAYLETVKAVVVQKWNQVKQVTTLAWNVIKQAISTVWESIKSNITQKLNVVKSVISSGWNAVKSVTSTVWNAIKGAVGKVWSGIQSVIKSGCNAVKSICSSIFGRIETILTAPFKAAKKVIDGIFGGITKSIKGLTDKIKGVQKSADKAKSSTKSATERSFINDDVALLSEGVPMVARAGSITDTISDFGNAVRNLDYKSSKYRANSSVVTSAATSSGNYDAGSSRLLTEQNALLTQMLQLMMNQQGVGVSLNIDGKQFAKATAPYMSSEMQTLTNRKNRLRGV